MQLQQPVGLYFVYGWRWGNGPYYLDNASTIEEEHRAREALYQDQQARDGRNRSRGRSGCVGQ